MPRNAVRSRARMWRRAARRAAAAALGAVAVAAQAAEEASAPERATVLYNGITLPAPWPPRLAALSEEPQAPPYLARPPEVIPIDVGRQLFVDDFLVESTTLSRACHQIEPWPENPVLKPDKPWEHEGTYRRFDRDWTGPYAMPFSDGAWYDPKDGLFKLWYMGGLQHDTCYATSRDGIHWEKPELDVKPGTNIVHPGNRDSCTVWLDPEDPAPARRFKMFRFEKTPRRGLALHVSADGIHWSDEVARAGACLDRTTVFYNPFRRVWVYSIKGSAPVAGRKDPTRVRLYWEQSDLLASPMWKEPEEPLPWAHTDRLDRRAEGPLASDPAIDNLDAVAYESVLLGLLSIHTVYGDKDAGRPKRNEIHAAFSRDGWHWSRPLREPLVGVSERKGDWNWGNMQSVGGCCLIVGDKLHVYYSGRAGSANPSGFWEAGGSTGLGFLRRDGFVSLDGGEAGGALTTRPVRFAGRHLFVNADAKAGELRAEVLDPSGAVIAPFSLANCRAVAEDKTLASVAWDGAEDLAAVAGNPVKFRFSLRNARLYAFWVSASTSGASGGYVAAGGPGFTGPRDVDPDASPAPAPVP